MIARLIGAVAAFIGAAVLKLFTQGHETLALVIAGLGALLLIWELVRQLKRRGRKRAARAISWIVVCGLVLGAAAFAVLEVPIVKGAASAEEPEAPYLIVLGAGVNGTEPSYILEKRLVATLDYMESYPDAVAVVSGGQGPGEDITEAESMARWLTARGVSQERILLEECATSTMENIAYSLDLLRERGETEPIRAAIVTSDFHLYRAVWIAQYYGMEAVGWTAPTGRWDLTLNYFMREAPAVLKMYLTCR